MKNTAYLFSGQGSQYSGMGIELADSYSSTKSLYNTASDILGFDLYDKIKNSDETELSKTIIAQPAIMITSLVALESLSAEYNAPCTAVAGHSLGEYAAMVASGILSLEDGIRVIKARAHAMQKAAEENGGVMYAILNVAADEIEKTCEKIDGYVVPVNYNNPKQTVIAGEESAVLKATEELALAGGKCVKLGVAAAFHSKFMQSAADEFYNELLKMKITFNSPNCKYFSNIIGGEQTDFTNMEEKLAKHIVSPVKFTDELYAMEKLGINAYVELGPNKVLAGLVKKTLKGAEVYNIENMKTLEKAKLGLSAE